MNGILPRLAAITAAAVLAAAWPALGTTGAAQPAWAVSPLSQLMTHGGFPAAGLPAAGAWPARPASSPQRVLTGVSIRSRAAGWAAGYQSGQSLSALIERWNGASWTPVAAPHPGQLSELTSVSTVSARDAWAAGTYVSGNSLAGLILHWNGRRWSSIPNPDPSPHHTHLEFLYGISAVSGSDAWAAGSYCAATCGRANQVYHPIILHWNGKRWSRVPSPDPAPFTTLNSVTALSPTDAWAAGYYVASSPPHMHTLILHWNGTRWSAIPAPESGILQSITAGSARNAWAAGTICHGRCIRDFRSLILHWNGTNWSRVRSPSPRPGSELNGVTATAPDSAWAVGSICRADCPGLDGDYRTLILHWNGIRWTTMTSPAPIRGWHGLAAVTATSSARAWAVGTTCTPSCEANEVTAYHPLAISWNGTRWSTSPQAHSLTMP